jgi:hypothetical protein
VGHRRTYRSSVQPQEGSVSKLVKSLWTAAPSTAEGPRKGEPSRRIVRNGLRTQPAYSVRGSSRRIMSLRFRPAHISVINRRASASAVLGPAVPTGNSRLTSGNVFPPEPPIEAGSPCQNGARRQGFASPRQTPARPCLLRAVPARPLYDGRLRREHSVVLASPTKNRKEKSTSVLPTA